MSGDMTWLESLNKEQREAVEHENGPCLVLAGAGSGKTRVLTTRVARLIKAGARPESIMAVTFTNKAAKEMRERVIGLVGAAVVGPIWKDTSLFLGTFHSWGAAFLRRHHQMMGWKEQYTILDADDAMKEIKAIVNIRADRDLLDAKRIRGIISDAKNSLLSPDGLGEKAMMMGDDTYVAAAEVYKEYEDRLQKMHAADFDDLLRYPVQLLEANADLRKYYRQKIQHILVDEYQDTNPAQDRLVRLVLGPERNLMVVGDDAQSIYSWRGSNVRTILDFDKEFPGAHVVRLEQNYRSTGAILDAANSLISHNLTGSQKTLWTSSKAGDGVVVVESDDDRGEARYVTDWVARLMADGMSAGDMAILYRTNAQSRLLEQAFNSKGIPYSIIGGLAFYERREVKDALGYARLALNPDDDNAFERIINVPRRGLGAKALDAIRAVAQTEGISLRLAATCVPGLSKAAREGLTDFIGKMESIEKIVHQKEAGVVLDRIVKDTGLRAALASEGDEGVERQENLDQLVAAGADFVSERGAGATLADFLANTALVQDADGINGAGVTLMTLHTSKGLEYKCVAVLGLEEGILPHSRAIAKNDDLEEERRLFYVGLTRAREKLLVGYAKRRRMGSEYAATSTSRFVEEIGRTRFVKYSSDGEKMPWHRANERRHGIQRQPGAVGREASPSDVGKLVRHATLGDGVIKAALGSGDNAQWVIEFKNGNKRVLKPGDLRRLPDGPARG